MLGAEIDIHVGTRLDDLLLRNSKHVGKGTLRLQFVLHARLVVCTSASISFQDNVPNGVLNAQGDLSPCSRRGPTPKFGAFDTTSKFAACGHFLVFAAKRPACGLDDRRAAPPSWAWPAYAGLLISKRYEPWPGDRRKWSPEPASNCEAKVM